MAIHDASQDFKKIFEEFLKSFDETTERMRKSQEEATARYLQSLDGRFELYSKTLEERQESETEVLDSSTYQPVEQFVQEIDKIATHNPAHKPFLEESPVRLQNPKLILDTYSTNDEFGSEPLKLNVTKQSREYLLFDNSCVKKLVRPSSFCDQEPVPTNALDVETSVHEYIEGENSDFDKAVTASMEFKLQKSAILCDQDPLSIIALGDKTSMQRTIEGGALNLDIAVTGGRKSKLQNSAYEVLVKKPELVFESLAFIEDVIPVNHSAQKNEDRFPLVIQYDDSPYIFELHNWKIHNSWEVGIALDFKRYWKDDFTLLFKVKSNLVFWDRVVVTALSKFGIMISVHNGWLNFCYEKSVEWLIAWLSKRLFKCEGSLSMQGLWNRDQKLSHLHFFTRPCGQGLVKEGALLCALS